MDSEKKTKVFQYDMKDQETHEMYHIYTIGTEPMACFKHLVAELDYKLFASRFVHRGTMNMYSSDTLYSKNSDAAAKRGVWRTFEKAFETMNDIKSKIGENDDDWYLCHFFNHKDKDDWFEVCKLKYIKDEMTYEDEVKYVFLDLDMSYYFNGKDIRRLKQHCIFKGERYWDIYDKCLEYFSSVEACSPEQIHVINLNK